MLRLQRPERLFLNGPTGRIEALLEEARSEHASAPQAFGVVCHPHPLQGGTLDNKVVHTLARTLQELGVPTLRFNFRGVGASEGEYAQGVGETLDALAVVAAGRERWPNASAWLLGFSFGGIVALNAAVRADARALITVAPAVGRIAIADGLPHCPWLLVQGDADEVLDARQVLDWAAGLEHAPTVRVLAGVGHFFHGRLAQLREAVREFAAPLLGDSISR
jgi:uncharacterized protein